MRIVLHGQQAFGKAVLEALLERGEDVVAVYAPPEGRREDPLAQAAQGAGLPLVRPASFHAPEVLDEFRAFAPDLQVMAFVTLEGMQGTVEMLCFPRIYQENRAVLEEDRVVKVRGRVDHKDEAEIKLIPFTVEEFVPRTGDEPICLTLDGEGVPATIIDDLKQVLCHFPGRCPVQVNVVTSGDRFCLRFGESYRVDPQTSLLAELKVLLGEAAVSWGGVAA